MPSPHPSRNEIAIRHGVRSERDHLFGNPTGISEHSKLSNCTYSASSSDEVGDAREPDDRIPDDDGLNNIASASLRQPRARWLGVAEITAACTTGSGPNQTALTQHSRTGQTRSSAAFSSTIMTLVAKIRPRSQYLVGQSADNSQPQIPPIRDSRGRHELSPRSLRAARIIRKVAAVHQAASGGSTLDATSPAASHAVFERAWRPKAAGP